MQHVSLAFYFGAHHYIHWQEEIWNRLSALRADLRNENERLNSNLVQVEKDIEARRELDRKSYMQYQREM